MSVQIVLTASPFPLAKLIRWMTNGRASHAMIQYDDLTWGGKWVAQASVGGVKMVRAEKAMHHVVAIFDCLFDAMPSLHAVRKHVGDRYDYLGLAFFGWALLVWRLFHRRIRRPWRNTTEEFCSEFVSLFLADAAKRGIVVNKLPADSTRTTPEQIFQALEISPQFDRML